MSEKPSKKLHQRRATKDDLATIVTMLADDKLGQSREQTSDTLSTAYIDAFKRIDADPKHYLMVVEYDENIVATCHLTLLASLTYGGQSRLQIEAVRVAKAYRGDKIGEWMIEAACDYANQQGASMIQLTTDKQRPEAIRFYQRLGFAASHQGMKRFI